MAVRLLGLPRANKVAILETCKQENITVSEYFREHGHEIKTFADLREKGFWFLQPSGNKFIYQALSWLCETPVMDEDKFAPESQRCSRLHPSGKRCLLYAGHKENNENKQPDCLVMGLVSF